MSRAIDNVKELILASAKEIAYNEGTSAISMRKLALNCNIALGTIYNYYPTKMDIIISIVEDFWRNCLVSFKAKENIDFFQEIESLYFHIYDYLEKFKSDFLTGLSSLSANSKNKGKLKEAEFMDNLVGFFQRILEKHKSEFNEDSFKELDKKKFNRFIIDQFLVMLKRQEKDYSFFDFTLKKILL